MSNYIVVDIGGTNVTIGYMQVDTATQTPAISKLISYKYLSQKYPNIVPPLTESIELIKKKFDLDSTPPICISSSGPTDGVTCQPSNLPTSWFTDKQKLESIFNTEIFLINDFAAIAYSLMTLQDNDKKITHIPRSPFAQFDNIQESIKVAIGAGTGLGTASVYSKNARTSLIPSEAGWTDFTCDPNDKYELGYLQFLIAPATSDTPYKTSYFVWEDAICGSRGINNIYHFFCDKEYSGDIIDEKNRSYLQGLLQNEPPSSLPPKISSLAQQGDEPCKAIFNFWVGLYAKYARQIALVTLPYGGVFIGGGVAAKNIALFLQDDLFYSKFCIHQNKNIEDLLKKIPLYIITEYEISLFGDAFYIHDAINSK